MLMANLLNADCTSNCARVAALETFLAIGLYLATIFWLPRFFVEGKPTLSGSEFKYHHPDRRWIIMVYPWLSWVAFLIALAVAFVITEYGLQLPPPHSFGMATIVWFTNINAFNGSFEVLTSISPSYGLVLKHNHRQTYLYHPVARRLGLARLAISLFVFGILGLIFIINLNYG